jgi:hypothetical protein
MKNLTAIEKLDTLLAFYADQQEEIIGIGKTADHFKTTNEAIREVLDRLLLDGFLKEIPYDRPMPSGYTTLYAYIITFDGRFFYENGGYKEQKRHEELANSTNELKEKIALRHEKLLVRGTWAAAIVGLLVLVWQVYSYFNPAQSDCNIFNNLR